MTKAGNNYQKQFQLFKIFFSNLNTIGFDNQMQNAQHGTITELLFQVFLFFLVLQMMKCEREADRRVHLLIMASLSYSFEKKKKKTCSVDLFSASFVKCSHVYLSGDFHRWRTDGRSSRPAREWRALCSCPVCEPTRPLRGRNSRARKRTLHCELLLQRADRNMYPTR